MGLESPQHRLKDTAAYIIRAFLSLKRLLGGAGAGLHCSRCSADAPGADGQTGRLHFRGWTLSVVVLVLCCASFLLLAHRYGYTTIGGRPLWLLDDDFMITQRYAQNLARGHGLVFNRGERVEGFSNPLTVLAISFPLELLKVDAARLGLYVWVINAIPHALIVLLLLRGRSGRPDGYGAAAAGAYLTLPNHGFFAHSGLEVYLQGLLLLAVAVGLTQRRGTLFYSSMALLPLVHPANGPTWLGAVILRLHGERRRWPRELVCLSAVAIPMIAWAVFRLAYYGELAPNTYFLKVSGVFAPRRGLRYVLGGFAPLAPTLMLLAVGLLRIERKVASLGTILLLFGPYLLSVIKVGGDTIPSHRMVFVIVPALLFFAAESLRAGPGAASGSVLAAGFLAAQLAVSAAQWPDDDAAQRRVLEWERSRTALGLAIRANTSTDQAVALFGLGLAGYFAERPAIDMLGKTDRHVARTRPKPWRQVAHQKSDPLYVLGRRPDFIEMPYSIDQVANDTSFLRQESRGRWGYAAELALEPRFQEAYTPVLTREHALPLWRRRDLPERYWRTLSEVAAIDHVQE